MIEDIEQLTEVSQTILLQSFVVFVRVGAMMAMIPAFGEQSVPARVKLGLAIAFTAIILPAVPMVGDTAGMETLILTESLTGLFLGLMLRLFVMALQVAGSIAAQSTSLSQIFGGAGMDPLPAMGHVLVVGGLAIATIMGLHVQIAEYMIHSYLIVPPGALISASVINEAGLREVSHAFALGFTLAAPFVIASLIYNVTLGVINKAMPQLMVAFVGAPAITAGGLIILMLAAPLILAHWVDMFGTFLMDPFGGQR